MIRSFTLLIFLFFTGTVFSQVPANNECSGSIDLNAFLGGGIDNTMSTSEFDNTQATTETTDPSNGYECFGEPDGGGDNPTLENTLWYSFTGDGNTYFIETTNCSGTASPYVSDGDTQIAIYTGMCGSLVAAGCNEDGPNATAVLYPAGITFETVSGVDYLMMIDGFAFNGVKSVGEFCIEITQSAGCTIAGFTAGDISPSGPSSVCINGDLSAISLDFDGTQTPGLNPNLNTEGYGWSVEGPGGILQIRGFEEFGATMADVYAVYDFNDIDFPAGEYCVSGFAYSGYTGGAVSNAECFTVTPSCLSFEVLAEDDPSCSGFACQDSSFSAGDVLMMGVPSDVCLDSDLSTVFFEFDGSQTSLELTDGDGYAWRLEGPNGGFTVFGNTETGNTLAGYLDVYAANGYILDPGSYCATGIIYSGYSGSGPLTSAMCYGETANCVSFNLHPAGDAACMQIMDPNICVGAMNIESLLGQGIGVTVSTGIQDNTNATTEDSDPDFGFDCFGEPDFSDDPLLNNTMWYTFTGDGNTYFMETTNCDGTVTNYVSDGDTQIAIYSGSCGNLTAVDCSEDGPNATDTEYPAGLTLATEAGTKYYVMIDGFSFEGAVSRGEYCVEMTQTEGCSIPNFSAGSMDLSNAPTEVCSDDYASVILSFDGTQTTGLSFAADAEGYAWVFRNNNGDLNYIETPEFAITLQDIEDALASGGGGLDLGVQSIYGFVWANLDTTVSTFPLDALCFEQTANTLVIELLDASSSACDNTAVNDTEILNVSNIYPVPADDFVNIDFFSVNSGEALIQLYDIAGREILQNVVNVRNGDNSYKIGIDDLESGVYFASLMLDANRTTFRIVKK